MANAHAKLTLLKHRRNHSLVHPSNVTLPARHALVISQKIVSHAGETLNDNMMEPVIVQHRISNGQLIHTFATLHMSIMPKPLMTIKRGSNMH